MSEVIPQIPKVSSLIIHSGNIVNWNRLKRKPNQSSTEELSECMRETLSNHLKEQDKTELQYVTEIDSPHTKYMEKLPKDTRGDLKITLKFFMCRLLEPATITKAIEIALKEMDVDFIETVLLSFPDFEDGALTLENIQPYWKVLEKLVEDEVVLALGISDLDKCLLEQLYDWAQIKPTINQVNLESCCVMPKDLTEYAKQKDIQLLTHNDPKDILSDSKLQNIIASSSTDKDAENWMMQWVIRYAVLVKCRGIIKTKAYITCSSRDFKRQR
ncbi:hypothetical protein FSP39_009591 [Pinctada imbricata]|uniref:GCS light chain n=1 Tax=Pinctada imbricata TaxID=66713 RepID=A0AA89BUC7_PINIB|nr:hypothetical protein FSP39_009591 [Pinctada imbricata]